MRVHLREFVCTAVLLAGFAGVAKAEEQLVMPFACRVEGGRVVLSPGPMQSYGIVGAREQRNFAACSPARPNRCRSFDLHRFELDCGGATVSWLSVVAALAPWTDQPYSIRGGRVAIEVGPRYRGAPMPCRVPVPYRPPGFYGPRGLYGPPGFYGPRFIVVPCPGGPQASRQFVNFPRGFAPIPARLVSLTSVPDHVAQAEAAPPPLPLRKETSGMAFAAQMAASELAKKSQSEPSPSPTALVAAESEITGAIPAAVSKTSASARQNLIGAVGFGLASLLFFGTALLLSRRRSRAVQLTVPLSREPVDDRRTAPNPPPIPQGQAPARNLAAEGEWLPSTLGDALIVLGASADAEGDMLKDLVKGLRRRWHPDHALNEEDRRTRERKLKQINVAWDIVCGKRRGRRHSRSRAA